ncbi:MAG TPA: Ig-like domain-containing protein, partial [Gemmatimonadales bacterium]
MLSSRLLAVVVLAAVAVAPPSTLQVLRYSPMGEATPTAQITVTFDRPVAGSLDRTVDAASIFKTEPSIEGRLEWRDPVTLRLVPVKPLRPGSTYKVTVANRFEAMDGSQLAEPFQFSFEVSGPAAIGGLPVSAEEHPRFLGPQATFDVVFSSELEVSNPRNLAYLEFDKACATGGVVRLKITGQRTINDKDPWQYREAGGWDRNRSADPLRRVVTFAPESALPYDCAGELVV